jgi:hypothetical protein
VDESLTLSWSYVVRMRAAGRQKEHSSFACSGRDISSPNRCRRCSDDAPTIGQVAHTVKLNREMHKISPAEARSKWWTSANVSMESLRHARLRSQTIDIFGKAVSAEFIDLVIETHHSCDVVDFIAVKSFREPTQTTEFNKTGATHSI